MFPKRFFDSCHRLLLSNNSKHRVDNWALAIAIIAFIVHLLVIFLVDFGLVEWSGESQLLTDPIAAIYTPFSFILVYEVYLLVFYLPYSVTVYIGKQYEIITLIIIRRIYKDLADIEVTSSWFQNEDDLILTSDLVASILLFGLIYLFNRLGSVEDAGSRSDDDDSEQSLSLRRFIRVKKVIATCLVPVILAMAVWSFLGWMVEVWSQQGQATGKFKDINKVFFEDFFRMLIIVDVLLLLISLFNTDQFHKIIRNSGFVISTILIRLSFSADGLVSTVLIVVAVLFGVAVLWVHNWYEHLKRIPRDTEQLLEM